MLTLQIDSSSISQNIFTVANIAGWVLSSLICVILTALVYPYLEEKFQILAARHLNFFKKSSGKYLAGKWTHTWYVDSSHFNKTNTIRDVEIRQFRKTIFAEYNVEDIDGIKYTYRMLGKIDNNMIITGTWKDLEPGNRYHGCFQLHIEINEKNLNGYWTGLSRQKNIKSDKWEWVRQ